MRIVLQRVASASVSINNQVVSSIKKGLLLLLGIAPDDNSEDIEWLCRKVAALRVFADAEDKMNLDIRQAAGEILVVSQFTLYASTKKGNRPSFVASAVPQVAVPLYESFLSRISEVTGVNCRSGVFGANMQVSLVNDGPVTIIIDSRQRE